jgi:hypothetical protein
MLREAFQNPESIFPCSGKLSRIPKVFFHAPGSFSESRKYFSRLREAFQNPESIFPGSGKLFRIPKVFFQAPGNFSESRKYFSRLRETFQNPESFPTSVKILSGFRKFFSKTQQSYRTSEYPLLYLH